jgi:hypothetical protein
MRSKPSKHVFSIIHLVRWAPRITKYEFLKWVARYRRATVGSSHDDAHPDNSALHTGGDLLFSAANHLICYFFPAATASRRRGNDLGDTIKYLRKITSGAPSIGLGTTAEYLRGAAGNGLAKRSSSFDALRAPPRAAA